MATGVKVDKDGWERFGAADHAMCQLTLQFSSHLHAIPGDDSLYTLDNEKLLE